MEVGLVIRDAGGWKWRFGAVEDYSNLNPYVSTWKMATALFAVMILIPALVGFLYWVQFLYWIASFDYWWLVLLVSTGGSFLWLWHRIIGKDWDTTQYAILLGTIVAGALFLHLNGFI